MPSGKSANSLECCVAFVEFTRSSWRQRLPRAATRVRLVEAWHDARFPAGVPCMDVVQIPFLRLWDEASGYWCTLEKDAGVFAQCLFGGNTPPMRMHCSAWAHPRQHPGWASAWRALHHSRGRIPATDVQLLGSDCEKARARPLSAAAPVPQASLRWGLGFV